MNSSTILKPTFYIIGVPKAGTSSLYHYLNEHPDIFMSHIKEPNFFLPKLEGLDQITDQQSYYDLFRRARQDQERGEASVGYLSYYSVVIPGIHQETPDAKFIVILRDPVERFVSQVRHSKRMGREDRSVKTVCKDLLKEYRSVTDPEHRIKDQSMSRTTNIRYVWFSRYHAPLHAFINHFGRENIKTVLFQQFVQQTANEITEIYNFLEVDPDVQPDLNTVHNKGGKEIIPGVDYVLKTSSMIKDFWQAILPASFRKRVSRIISSVNKSKTFLNRRDESNRLSEDQKKRLRRFFEPDIRPLQGLISKDLSHWLP